LSFSAFLVDLSCSCNSAFFVLSEAKAPLGDESPRAKHLDLEMKTEFPCSSIALHMYFSRQTAVPILEPKNQVLQASAEEVVREDVSLYLYHKEASTCC
jgi:hypothetical protein